MIDKVLDLPNKEEDENRDDLNSVMSQKYSSIS